MQGGEHISAKKFLKDEARVDWHNRALLYVQKKRDRLSRQVPEWEKLRTMAGEIKEHTLANLSTYLPEFEKNALQNGITVHRAENARQHNEIVRQILKDHDVTELLKSKSMLTEECGLNGFLKKSGIGVVETDLGEWIVQMDEEIPSHIVLPAIHKKASEIGELFHQKLNTPGGNQDAVFLTGIARKILREKFIRAKVALTGVNFGIAETGSFVVCTNEGNADMGVQMAGVHIASMGIEKLIPTRESLGVFTRLLARSATGQPITVYTSHYRRPAKEKEIHLILVDNGRTDILSKPLFRDALKCIRCGACLNTCPVYRRRGGHSYGYTIPGPIGSVLTPHYDPERYAKLPYASTLCGSCSNVCPVKINLHEQLYRWRQSLTGAGVHDRMKKRVSVLMAWVFRKNRRYRRVTALLRRMLRITPKFIIDNRLNPWTFQRDLPDPPPYSFHDWAAKGKLK